MKLIRLFFETQVLKKEMFIETGRRITKITIQRCVDEFSGYLDRLDKIVLLGLVLKKEKEFVLTHPDYHLSERELKNWKEVVSRRLKGEPVAYITGQREFYSLNFFVNRFTLIPRPETEHIVEKILMYNPSSFIDIGTGCGNIAVTVKYYLPWCKVFASDISREAVKVAEKNAGEILGDLNGVIFYHGSFFEPVPEHLKFDIIASNPPYIRRKDIEKLPLEIKEYEPIYALDGGEDGLEAYRKILRGAGKRLNKDGVLILEIDELILEGFMRLCSSMHYDILEIVNDYRNKPRVAILSKNQD